MAREDLLKPLQSISVYESRTVILIVGFCLESKKFLVLEVKRTASLELSGPEMLLHPISYTSRDVDQLTTQLKCIRMISDAYSIYGFIRLVESYYIIIVTKATCIATLYGHNLYTISDTNIIPITYKVRNTMEETRYKSILQNLNLSNNEFYFSYTLDLTCSLQKNMTSNSMSSMKDDQKNMYIWNYFALNPFIDDINSGQFQNFNKMNQQTFENSEMSIDHDMNKEIINLSRWIVPIIYGFLKQKTIRLMTGYSFRYTLIARRSRFFAGTRYLRRGVDIDGFTANEVETEQIITNELNQLNNLRRSSSLVQIRGSIPLYWYHINHFIPSPDIRIDSNNGYNAAILHFDRLIKDYGDNVMVLNLVRTSQSTREVTVGKAFEELIISLNEQYRGIRGVTGVFKDYNLNDKNADENEAENKNNDQVDGDRNIINNSNNNDESITSKVQHESNGEQKSIQSPKKATKIGYVAFDFHGSAHAHNSLFSKLGTICDQIFPKSGFYTEPPAIINRPVIQNYYSKEKKPYSTTSDGSLSKYVLWPIDNITNEIDTDKSLSGLINSSQPKLPRNISQPSGPERGPSPILHDLIAPCIPATNGSSTSKSSIFDLDYDIYNGIECCGQRIKKLEDQVENNFDTCGSRSLEIDVGVGNECSGSGDFREGVLGSGDGGLGSGVCHGLLQHGVLRTNCIDCLDRTNVAQFAYAQCALPYQFKSLGVELSPEDMQRFADICTEIWAQHGDALAQQYGGSGAMHSISASNSKTTNPPSIDILEPLRNLLNPSRPFEKFDNMTKDSDSLDNDRNVDKSGLISTIGRWAGGIGGESEREFALSGGAKNAFVAVQRYYSNVSTDFERQQSIDLLLGTFQPSRGGIPIWDTDMNIPTVDRGKNEINLENNDKEFKVDICIENKKDINHVNDTNETLIEKNKIHIDNEIDNDNKNDIYHDKDNRSKIFNNENNSEKLYCFPHKNLNFVMDEYQDIETSETDLSIPEYSVALDMATYTPYPAQPDKISKTSHKNITAKNKNVPIKNNPQNSIDVQYKSPSKFFSEISNLNLFNFRDSGISLIPTPLIPSPVTPTPVASSSSSTCIPKSKSSSEKNIDKNNKKNNSISKKYRNFSDTELNDYNNQIEIIDLKDNSSTESDISPHIIPKNSNSNNFENNNFSTADKIGYFFSYLFSPIPLSDPNFVRKIDLDLHNQEYVSENTSSYENVMNVKDDNDNVFNDDIILGEYERKDCDEKTVSNCQMQ